MLKFHFALAALTAALSVFASGCDARNPGASGEPGPIPAVAYADAATLASFDRWEGRPQRIVLIVVDTLRRDVLPFYGGAASMPNLEALAARSQIFQNAFGSYYQTSMSMGALFTGRTPSLETSDTLQPIKFGGLTWCGLARLAGENQRTCIPEGVPTLGQALRESGYWTIGVASNGFLFKPYGADRGFDDWTEVGERMPPFGKLTPELWTEIAASRSAGKVNRAMLNALFRRKSDNFLLYLHYMDVHDYRNEKEGYLQTLATLDEGIGEILRWLENAKLMEGTTIVLTADHGERLGEEHFTTGTLWHGGNPAFEETLAVPLLITPRVSDDDAQLMRSEDIYRVITRMAGSELGGEESLERDELFITEPLYQTYRKGRFKTFVHREDGAQTLIDLESDPAEMRNVAEQHPEVAAEHAERIAQLAQELAAPDAGSIDLTDEDKRRLRELGYLK